MKTCRTKNRGVLHKEASTHSHVSLHSTSRTMGYFKARSPILGCRHIPTVPISSLPFFACCYASSFVVTMGLVSVLWSFLPFFSPFIYSNVFMVKKTFLALADRPLCESYCALEIWRIKLLYLIPIITTKNWVLLQHLFAHIQTQMHTHRAITTSLHATESIPQPCDTPISRPDSPLSAKLASLAPYPASAGPKLWQKLGTGSDH